ncbi:MAG: tyrosine-type recombinase/integrase [Bifidobacteriaceae bacterium]|nr:tyrosine-type recombinase/integrase [Bifidobacteriaceae bacterium]
MSPLRELLGNYLATRRALGFKLAEPEHALTQFVDFMEETGETTIRHDLATAWASRFNRSTVLVRLNMVRQFAEHVAWFDPATEVPVLDAKPYVNHRPRPRICSEEEIDALLRAAGRLTPEFKAATWQTILGLVSITGLRISEACALDDTDITSHGNGGQALVRESKFGKSRIVPLHTTTMSAVAAYQRLRDRKFPGRPAGALFVTRKGTRPAVKTAGNVFRQIRALAGMTADETGPAVEWRHLRHSFATNTLIRHIRSGGDVDQMMPVLSTWLGHVGPASTYWYLSNTPELAAALGARLPVIGGSDE